MKNQMTKKIVQPLFADETDDLLAEIGIGEPATFLDVDDAIAQTEPVKQDTKLTKFVAPVAAAQLKQSISVEDVQWPEIVYASEVQAQQALSRYLQANWRSLTENAPADDELTAHIRFKPQHEIIYRSERKAQKIARREIYHQALDYFQTQPSVAPYTPDDFFRGREM